MPCLQPLLATKCALLIVTIGNVICLAYSPYNCLRKALRVLNMPPRAGDILSVVFTLNNVLSRTVCSRHGCRRVKNSSIALAWRLHGNRRVHNRWNGLDSSCAAESGLDSSRAAERYSLDDRLSCVVSDVISVSTDRTSARCRENVRSRIWRFVEDRRRFPSAILITETNSLTVVKRREISCVQVMLIHHVVLTFLKSLSHFIVVLARVHDLC